MDVAAGHAQNARRHALARELDFAGVVAAADGLLKLPGNALLHGHIAQLLPHGTAGDAGPVHEGNGHALPHAAYAQVGGHVAQIVGGGALENERLVRRYAVAHAGRPAQADFFLYGEGAGDIAGVVVFQQAHQRHAAHAVVQSLGLDEPFAEFVPVGAEGHVVARLDQLFGFFLCRSADVDI